MSPRLKEFLTAWLAGLVVGVATMAFRHTEISALLHVLACGGAVGAFAIILLAPNTLIMEVAAQQPPAADALQRTLLRRSRFQARLRRSVRLLQNTGGKQAFLSWNPGHHASTMSSDV